MQIQTFEFADSGHLQAGALRDPVAIGERLELLRKQSNGELTAEAVLADARNSNSPLHSHFEWDDSAAAELYRLRQARHLIRTVVAVYKETPGEEPIKTRAYIHVRPMLANGASAGHGTKGHYMEASHAMSVPDTRRQVLETAMREMKAWKQRYGDLKEFAAVVAAMDEAEHGLRTA